MKVLFAYDRNTYTNPFVRILADSIQELGVDVTCSMEDFWHSWNQYDIIHLQWPNLLASGLETVEPLKKHLLLIKKSGIPMLITCHNLHPHYTTGSIANDAYEIVYDLVDCFIHMGGYSCELFKEKYPRAKHVIIPHHVYDPLYNSIPTKEKAKKHLGLNSRRNYILCFGTFRHDEEREIAIKASEILAEQNYKVLAPAFSPFWFRRDNILLTVEEFMTNLRYRLKYKNIIITKGFVLDEDIPYYYAAADIALIQRKEILNSGNLPMAFFMGKVVVGPNVGNVGETLQKTGNPVFDINNNDSLEGAIKKALILATQSKGEENRQYAINNLSSKIVAQQHKDLYQSLINNALAK